MVNPDPKVPQIFDEVELSEQEQALLGLELAFRTANARIPEKVFKEVFIPFFAQETMDVKYPTSMAQWVSIAGHPSASVDVVDEKGKVLFTVPPMLDNRIVNTTPVDGQTPMQHIIKTFQQYNNIHPAQGRDYLEGQFARRKLLIEAGPLVIEQLRIWDGIFVRYGRKPFLQPDDTAPVQTKPGAAKDDFDYAPM